MNTLFWRHLWNDLLDMIYVAAGIAMIIAIPTCLGAIFGGVIYKTSGDVSWFWDGVGFGFTFGSLAAIPLFFILWQRT